LANTQHHRDDEEVAGGKEKGEGVLAKSTSLKTHMEQAVKIAQLSQNVEVYNPGHFNVVAVCVMVRWL